MYLLRSVAFDIANMIYFFYKRGHLNEEVNCTEPYLIGVYCNREPLPMERLSTVDLQVLTCLDKLLLILQASFTFFYKTSHLNEEVNCTEPSIQLVFAAAGNPY